MIQENVRRCIANKQVTTKVRCKTVNDGITEFSGKIIECFIGQIICADEYLLSTRQAVRFQHFGLPFHTLTFTDEHIMSHTELASRQVDISIRSTNKENVPWHRELCSGDVFSLGKIVQTDSCNDTDHHYHVCFMTCICFYYPVKARKKEWRFVYSLGNKDYRNADNTVDVSLLPDSVLDATMSTTLRHLGGTFDSIKLQQSRATDASRHAASAMLQWYGQEHNFQKKCLTYAGPGTWISNKRITYKKGRKFEEVG